MADDELDLDVEVKSGKGKKILLIVGVLLFMAISVGAALYFTGVLGGSSKGDNKAEDSVAQVEAEKPEPRVTLYMPLKPEFVVNFEDTSMVNYMQVEMQIMSRQQHALDLVTQHMPVIRNNILILLSTQKYEEVNTAAGKEKLRIEVLASIQQVLDEESANQPANQSSEEKEAAGAVVAPKIEAVYFTSLIMQ